VSRPEALRGQEVRFLRAQLGLSQGALARLLRVRRGAVARWEANREKAINGTADTALRGVYALRAANPELSHELCALFNDLDALSHANEVGARPPQRFEVAEEGWQRAMAA
jgi:transcriptional regulator with XRE-family HTH domain